MKRSDRVRGVLKYFQEAMPSPQTELNYSNPYELLVAVILSAQCTDKRVNMVTPALFERYPSPGDLSKATPDEIFGYIKSCSYPNNKSKNLAKMARILVNEFNEKVPEEVDELQKLPGVGRKTANVIASVIYNKPAMAVDTHVFRVAARIGLTINAKTPLDAEIQLVKLIPPELLPLAHHWLILHGRYVCKARRPLCHYCQITDMCRQYKQLQMHEL